MKRFASFRTALTITVLSFVLFLLSDCTKESNPTGPSGSDIINVGPTVDAGSITIGPGGGTFTVSKPGTPVDGMQIIVPSNAYPETRTFSVSYATIQSHQLGEYFNPVSPLIKISNGGGYSDLGMKVKVPVHVPSGYFAMGFFYDEITGKLEGLPVEALDSNSITVSTRHFASNSGSLGKFGGYLRAKDLTSLGNLIISSIEETKLNRQPVISSGFKPGIDDWEFINYGSSIAPGGHCAGQSMTAMWYYYEKKLKGDSALFHRYDRVNDRTKPAMLWQDNPNGYRFASTIQEDFDFDGWIRRLKFQFTFPQLTWKAFALAMLVTGEPQSVLIMRSTDSSGHAMIVYKIGIAEGKLYIADPNFPNNRGTDGTESIRTINFTNGKFDPYPSSLNAASSPILFDEIGYFGKTTFINWPQIGTRWAQFQSGTIGNGLFPNYWLEIIVRNGNVNDLQDKMNADSDTLKVQTRCSCNWVLPGTDHSQRLDVYDTSGNLAASGVSQNKGIATKLLKPGSNKFGFYIMGANEKSAENYVDFKWMSINRTSLQIYPDTLKGDVNIDYTFTARTNGTAPQNAKYTWNFGDGSSEVTKTNDSLATHRFSKAGIFSVAVSLYESATGMLLTTAKSRAAISAPRIDSISPDSGKVGDKVTIVGVNFGNTSATVSFNGVDASEGYSWSDTKIEIKVPVGATSGNIVVWVNGQPSNGKYFKVLGVQKPVITELWPFSALPGNFIRIYGTWDRSISNPPNSYVKLNGAQVNITQGAWSSTWVQVSVPDNAQTGWGTVLVVYQGIESLPQSYLIGIPMDSLRKCNLLLPDYLILINMSAQDGTNYDWVLSNSCALHPYESVVWNGNQFRCIWRDTMQVQGVSHCDYVSDVTGTISVDGTMITSLVIDRTDPYGNHARIVLKLGKASEAQPILPS